MTRWEFRHGLAFWRMRLLPRPAAWMAGPRTRERICSPNKSVRGGCAGVSGGGALPTADACRRGRRLRLRGAGRWRCHDPLLPGDPVDRNGADNDVGNNRPTAPFWRRPSRHARIAPLYLEATMVTAPGR